MNKKFVLALVATTVGATLLASTQASAAVQQDDKHMSTDFYG